MRGSACSGLPVPAEYGGQGQDLATTVAAMEGLGYGCPDTGLIFAIGASLWTVTMPILAFGTEPQKEALPARPVRRHDSSAPTPPASLRPVRTSSACRPGPSAAATDGS